MHRLFIAIDFPDEVRESVANMCIGIPVAKWVSKDQLHLTLRFVGDVDARLFSDIQDVLHDVNASTFSITLKGVGYFPPRKKPNTLWVGIEPCEALTILRDEIELLMEELGLEPEKRKYHPHLTVARLRPEAPLDRITGFLAANSLFKVENVPVSEFHLYSSVLMPAGAVHTMEASYQLI
jgi:2'-5' RNA ligase